MKAQKHPEGDGTTLLMADGTKETKMDCRILTYCFVARRRLLLVLMVVTISKNLLLCNARGRTRRNRGKHGRIDV